ncbi:MAG TPA: His/Gly/Thr/Pro-type tRNA ligase C-terminal domain-containing protein, partial [Patescibacteria group bacterium]|nr:His/Gly/Thr/Pro-type tRNA ligase C-terminal domain-containing protein [Patescibacteria group bacterium]
LFAVTIDFETLEDKKVTVRDRDTMKQDRVEISQLMQYFQRKLNE